MKPSFLRLAAACAAVAACGVAPVYAANVAGMVDTSAAFSPTNQSFDGSTYYNAPAAGPFPSDAFTVGEFDFSLSPGFAVTGGTISGDFGSDVLGSATAEVDLYVDQVLIARCDSTCATASETADVAWTHTFTGSELGALGNGRLVLTAIQQGPSQVVLDPTSVSLDIAAAVPEPGTAWLTLIGGVPLIARALRRRRAVRA